MRILQGRRALVTGAASGIGRCIALGLAQKGAHLYLVDIHEQNLQQVAEEAQDFGTEVVTRVCDLSCPEQVSTVGPVLLEQWPQLDILVNNAGVAYYGPTEAMTEREWQWLLQINLLTPIQLTHQLLPTLKAQPEAHILNVASIAGLVPSRKLAAYHTSKFGLVGFSESLRVEQAGTGLGVTTLCPGLVRTRIFESAHHRKKKPLRTPPRWISSSPETVARKAVRAIEKNKGMVLVSPLAHFLWYVQRFCPFIFETIHFIERCRASRAAKKKQKHQEQNQPEKNRAA